MLRVDPTLNHIPARREHVVSLYESINQPLVNIPNHGTAPTGAFLLGTRNEHGYYTVFVYLHQPDTRAVIIYVSEPRSLTAEQFRVEESEAVRFVESMGFMVDSLHFRQLGAPEQDAIMGRVPIFRPPVVTLDLYDVADEQQQRPPPDPIFGSIGPAGNEVFRRAGLSPGMSPGMSPVQGGPHFGGPGSGPMAGPAVFGSPTPSMSGLPQHMNPLASQPGLVPPGMIAAPAGMQPMMGPGSNPQQSALQSMHGGTPLPGTDSGTESPEALERLGRLLAAFGVLLSIVAAPLACKTPDQEVPTGGATPLQNELDIGHQQLAERKFADAIGTFNEVLEKEPKDRDALRGTGLAYLGLNRPTEAEPFYRRAIEADPKWSEPKYELAGILITSKRCEEAETLLRAVRDDIFYADPDMAEHSLAIALSCLGKKSEAVSRLETLVVKRPHFCLGYLTLSQFSLQTKQPEVTVKACEDFIFHCAKNEKIREQVTPEHTSTCYLRSGMAYVQMGDVESARTSFMRCMQADSNAVGKDCQAKLEHLPK